MKNNNLFEKTICGVVAVLIACGMCASSKEKESQKAETDTISYSDQLLDNATRLYSMKKDFYDPKHEITFLEKEKIARYKFDLLDDLSWREVVSTIIAEAGSEVYGEAYDVTSVVLNRLITPRWIRSNPGNFYSQLTRGQFTAYNNSQCQYPKYMSMSIDELRNLPSYQAIVDCLFQETPDNEYSQFRWNKYSGGVLLNQGGNKYLDSVSDEEKIPLEERDYYQRVVDAYLDSNNSMHELIMMISVTDPSSMDSLKYYTDKLNTNELGMKRVLN